jgi:SAM-dependent methyltransferase
MTTRDEARRFFDSIAGRYDRVYAPSREESRARLSRVLAELAKASRVLDLGVGTGRELSSLQDAGHAVTGLDLSPEMLSRCSKRSRPIATVLGDLWDALPFESEAFDAVVALHGTLAHPPSEEAPRALALEVGRVLSPGGVFVMEVPLPAWVEASRNDDERAFVKIADARAQITDSSTRASIEAWLFPTMAWKDALSTSMVVAKAIEESSELFLVARRPNAG